MRAFLLILAVLPCLAAAPPASQPADDEKPISLPEAKAKSSLQSLADLAGLPVIDAPSIDKVFKLSLKDKVIVLDPVVAPAEDSLVRIPNFPGVSRIKYLGIAEPNSPPQMLQFDFENRDYTIPKAICRYTTASFAAGTVTLTQMLETLEDEAYSVQLLQHSVPPGGEGSPAVSLYVQIEAEKIKLQLTANDVIELRRKYPGEVAKYVDPIFQALKQDALLARVNPQLAWQVFADFFTPPPALAEQINQIIKDLDAQNFRDREAASKQLDAMGEPAALLLMRWPRQGLSDEQDSRIDVFIAKFKPVSDEEAARLKRSRDFLLDCLASDEPAIRAAALTELKAVTKQPITFDAAASPLTQSENLAKLRETLGSPSTRQFKEE